MRVISQDGTIDVPYERFIISVNMQEQSEIIAWTGNHISYDECIVMASYSTKEKAIKSIEMLKEKYENNEFYHHMSTTDIFKETMVLLSNEKFKESTSEYFKFPKDEDVEPQSEQATPDFMKE